MEAFVLSVKKLWEQKEIVDGIKDQLADASKVFEELKGKAMKAMEVMELDKQHVPGCGTIYRQKNFSVKVPKSPAEKEALFNWIAEHKGKDVLDNMISIHSQSLNSFYKSELEIAKEAGNVDFKIPGIDMPEVYWTLGMRAK